MANFASVFFAGLLSLIVNQATGQGRLLMCYYTAWSQYRARPFRPNNVDPTLCTHAVFAFAKVEDNQVLPYDWNDVLPNGQGMFTKFTALKAARPGLKTLLAVGGFNMRAEGFSRTAESAAGRRQFAASAVTLLRQHGFDGLDVDWEYPAHPGQGGRPQDKQNFGLLLKEVHEEFAREAGRTGRAALLLTSAVAVGYNTVANGYDVPTLNRYLDLINLMTYDLHGSWDRNTGHNGGLYTAASDPRRYSVKDTAENWVSLGAWPNKTLIGLPLYGRVWTLADPANTAVGAKTIGPGLVGKYTNEAGVLSYYEICERAFKGGYTLAFDEESKAPYAYKGNQWITYDNTRSLKYKMEWLVRRGFAGAFVWAYDMDDFDGGSCDAGRYPLLRAISACLVNDTGCTSNGDNGNGGGGATIPILPTNGEPDCPYTPGAFRDRYDCGKFWVCQREGGVVRKWRFSCPPDMHYDLFRRACDLPARVDCTDVIKPAA